MAEDQDSWEADTAEKLLELKNEFAQGATPLDRLSGRARAFLSLPLASIGIGLLALGWGVANAFGPRFGWRAWDPPPFQALQVVGTIASVVIASLILAGQRREDLAAHRRSELTLHLAALSEQKIAKLVALLEEQRRHNPMLPDREDEQAEQMARPAEPRELLERLAGEGEAGGADASRQGGR